MEMRLQVDLWVYMVCFLGEKWRSITEGTTAAGLKRDGDDDDGVDLLRIYIALLR